MKIVVLGSGYVAQGYLRALFYLGYFPLHVSRSWCDYTDPEDLRQLIAHYDPEVVINCAGYTGTTVDDCQLNRQECYFSNVTFAGTLATICKKLGASLIHVSSGCIYNGPGPFSENDLPNLPPDSPWYGVCKLNGEQAIVQSGARAWIFRIRMPFGYFYHPRNLLVKLAHYDKILDGLNSVTFLDEFCMRSWQLADKAAPGIYHAASSTPIHTGTIAQMLLDSGIRTKPVVLWDPEEFLKTHVRRSTAVLNVSKFEQAYGSSFGGAETAIRIVIAKMKVANLG